jgi:inosine-uridine nucleoside N-ribohydrolase
VYWWGRDRAAYSGAAYHLMLEARKTPTGEKLNVVSLGALTNVASALMMDPAIAPKLRLYWIGAEVKDGVWNKNEFNCLNDIHALNVVLDAHDLELFVMPANVARALTFDYAATSAKLKGCGRLAEFLLRRWDQHGPGAASRIMWGLAAVQWLLEPGQVRSRAMPAPPENTKRDIQVATSIDAPAMRAEYSVSCGHCTRSPGSGNLSVIVDQVRCRWPARHRAEESGDLPAMMRTVIHHVKQDLP